MQSGKRVCIIKHQFGSPAVAAQQLAHLQCNPWSVSHSDFMWCIVGGEVLENGGGGLLQNLMWEGDPEVPFTSPSAISHSHRASARAEQRDRPVCGREPGPCNLYSPCNANFQFNTLGKRERAHTVHSGQELLQWDLSWITVDSRMVSRRRSSSGATLN